MLTTAHKKNIMCCQDHSIYVYLTELEVHPTFYIPCLKAEVWLLFPFHERYI